MLGHDNYYLIANSERHGLTHCRVDKMEQITETGISRIQTPESKKLNLADYAKKIFDMFNGEETAVKLRFRNELAGVVIDRFGQDSMLIPDGDDCFLFTARGRCLSPFPRLGRRIQRQGADSLPGLGPPGIRGNAPPDPGSLPSCEVKGEQLHQSINTMLHSPLAKSSPPRQGPA